MNRLNTKIDYQLVREKVLFEEITTDFVGSNDQLADIFTKSLKGPRVETICNKLNAYDISAPAFFFFLISKDKIYYIYSEYQRYQTVHVIRLACQQHGSKLRLIAVSQGTKARYYKDLQHPLSMVSTPLKRQILMLC